VLEGESTIIKPTSVKYYSRFDDSDSNPDLSAENGRERSFSIEDK
jgi:hypothetical protein